MSVSGVGVTVAAPAPEAWEHMRDSVRNRIAALLTAHPRAARRLRQTRAVGLWVALGLVAVLAVTQPRYRQGIWVYASCFYLLLAWFVLARTKTVTWAGVARMFAFGVTWSWVIAFVSFRLGAASGAGINDAGPGAAIASFTEESLKLVPLAVIALIAPGRVKRLAAVDWLLLGLAAGLGFQAWEDLLRRVATAVRPPDLFATLIGTDNAPAYSWSPVSGGFAVERGGLLYGYAGHHVFTALIAGAAGLAVAGWRRPQSSMLFRAAMLGLPLLAWGVAVTDHFAYNAGSQDRNWYDAPGSTAPWLIRTAWPLLGHGNGKGWWLLAVLLACLLVDAAALRQAGDRTDLDVAGWLGRPRLAGQRLTMELRSRLTGSSVRLAGLAVPFVDLVVFAARDVALTVTAHAREPGETRLAALVRGRAMSVLLREVRADALQPPDQGRRKPRLLALLTLGGLGAAATLPAEALARRIGNDLTPAWLAGQFDALGDWWAGLSPGQQILAGASVAALVALSGGSLGLALGTSGAFTYVAGHGQGAATFTRDPVGATRSWLTTTTPLGAALDTTEFALTFLPTNAAGAVTGRGVRALTREYAEDPAAFWARRRALHAADPESGAARLSMFYGTGGPRITEERLGHSAKHFREWAGRKLSTQADRDEWRSLVERATRSNQIVEWNAKGEDTYLHLARVTDGRWFAVEFSRDTHELVTAFTPHPGQLTAILRKLGK